jgi:uncharacterized protein
MRSRTVRLAGLAATVGTLAIAPALHAAGRPSFDCSRASSWAERTICNDDTLCASDREMSAAFATRRAALGDVGRQDLLTEQRRWLGRRGECRTAAMPVPCLEQLYRERIAALGGQRDPAPPPPDVDPPPPARTAAAGAWAECRTDGDTADGLCLDRLLAAATGAFGDAESAMLKRLAGADGAAPNPAAAEAFRASQDAFLRFRDATCQWRGAAAGASGDGVRQACQVDYTRARTAEITAALR